MRVLLDECVPRPLGHELTEHEVSTVQELGWSGTKNGELLRRTAEASFDVLVTTDQNLEHQKNLERLREFRSSCWSRAATDCGNGEGGGFEVQVLPHRENKSVLRRAAGRLGQLRAVGNRATGRVYNPARDRPRHRDR